MAVRLNPYRPGPGIPPLALVSRDALLAEAGIAIAQAHDGVGIAPLILIGIRGTGKTVLLRRIAQDVDSKHIFALAIEGETGRPFGAKFRAALEGAIDRFEKIGPRLASVARKLIVVLPAVSVDVPGAGSVSLTPRVPDHTPAGSLTATIKQLNEGLRAHDRNLVLLVDEVQEIDVTPLRTLLTTIHESLATPTPILLVAAGTPEARAQLRAARTYAIRFTYEELGFLSDAAVREALIDPARAAGGRFTPEALDLLIPEIGGYPFFVQMYGAMVWQRKSGATVDTKIVRATVPLVHERLDREFYGQLLDGLSARESTYVLALASMAPSASVTAVAAALGRTAAGANSIRNRLIKKGMIYTPSYGQVACAVPLLDRFIARHPELRPPLGYAHSRRPSRGRDGLRR